MEAALTGSLATLNARLRTLEDGAEASALLASVAAACQTIGASAGKPGDVNSLSEIISDFKTRCAQAEGRWFGMGKLSVYRTAFAALAADLSEFPELAAKVAKRRQNAVDTSSVRGEVMEFRTSAQRILVELGRLAGVPEAGAVPLLPAPSTSVDDTKLLPAPSRGVRRVSLP